jgi:hypothetical protein
MKNFDASQLLHFTGTERSYRISRRHLLNDGTKYLAEEAECFWMMDAIASHLSEIGTDDWFDQVRMTVNDNRATMIYEDGNGKSMLAKRFRLRTFQCQRCHCMPAGTGSLELLCNQVNFEKWVCEHDMTYI